MQTLSRNRAHQYNTAAAYRENFTVLADVLVEEYGSPAMKQYNKTLRAWRRVWDQFRVRNQDTKIRPFSADPLPFWYLRLPGRAIYALRGEVEFKVAT